MITTLLRHKSLLVLAVGLCLQPKARAQTTFTLDPTRSSLTILNANFSESAGGTVVGSGTLTAQAPGSTVTTYSGTLSATLGTGASPTSIVFNSAAAAAAQTGAYTPTTGGATPGGSGTQAADYGLTGTTSGAATATINAALDAVVLSLASGTIPLNNGTFSVTGISVPLAGNYGYRSSATALGTIRGGGAFTNGNPPTPTDASSLSGSYAVANGVATLTIPIDVTYSSTSSNLNGNGTATVVTEVVGTLTATAAVPEPATDVALLLAGVATMGLILRRRA